jgi:hypothetical protein
MSEEKKHPVVTVKADFFKIDLTENHVAHCTVETEGGMWEETFGSAAEANAFFKGVQAGCSLLGGRAQIQKTISGKIELKRD